MCPAGVERKRAVGARRPEGEIHRDRHVPGEDRVLHNADGVKDGCHGQAGTELAERVAVLEPQNGGLESDAAQGADGLEVQANER